MTAFVVESWIWYSVTICMVLSRMVSRLLLFRSLLRLQIEDYLMIFLTCLYTILIVFLNIDLNVSTNLIDPAHPVVLTPQEISQRTWGSKTVLLVEQCMCAVQWGTKCCLLLLYWRLTQNLKQALVVKVAAAYVAITYIVMEICYFAVWCRPFHDYWQTPTNNVQCTTALHHLIMNLVFNLSSDILILSIPLPLFVKAHLELKKKILLVFPFSLGLFTMLCAILSKRLSFTHPYSSEWVYWYCREASTAMIVTNMPYSWALIRRIFNLRSFFGDSTADRLQAGQARELHGYSPGAIALDSQPRSRQASQAEGVPRKLSWHRLKLHKTQEDASNPWPAGELAKEKEVKVEANTASSSASSAGSVRRPPPAANTDWTLDRLYPLDDEEITAPDVTHRRYEGV
ncbi:uncharacterized protein Z519_09859 [Cladophialophora bantiana CBS 173.52]|uniref:Rhodopsin domain-containing protein n=1 Tax=Cladophialophora bantiana (strain ATCC 10958 / CBS 173.52 / CDC B-1940 / NIH 8579) TaxID=1442370 RepID=A0A0D2H8V5_CLAB1|nr:uncharacterized protein Z519_09859 [Cladophialophora bantiana CBS 173.52]KIW89703.1 hypothetical protein Z519_09859 [Cladophialophora bantiana CBS 173.52]